MSDTNHSVAGESHGSVKSYVIGLILSIILTLVAFGVVMSGDFSKTVAVATILTMAVLQVLVQLVMFMHMNTKSEGGWNFVSFVFAISILVLVIGGSIWIMHHLHLNMMAG